MHGGSVTADSDGAGRGTTVTLRLPVQTTPTTAGADGPETSPLPVIAPRRILVVDDNDDAAEALALLLQMAGHEVRTADNGVDALAVGEAFQPDVVLLDLGMPKLNGYETAREMRRQAWGQDVTLVALTGWGQPQDRREPARPASTRTWSSRCRSSTSSRRSPAAGGIAADRSRRDGARGLTRRTV